MSVSSDSVMSVNDDYINPLDVIIYDDYDNCTCKRSKGVAFNRPVFFNDEGALRPSLKFDCHICSVKQCICKGYADIDNNRWVCCVCKDHLYDDCC